MCDYHEKLLEEGCSTSSERSHLVRRPGLACSVCHEPTGIRTRLDAIQPGLVFFALCRECRGLGPMYETLPADVPARVLALSARLGNELAAAWPSRIQGSA